VEPVAYSVQDEDHPHRIKLIDQTGDGVADYVDVVNQMFVQPTDVEIAGFGTVPTCYLIYNERSDCAPSTVTVRNSFLRVDPGADYQPQIYTGDRMERFGYFVTDRLGFDEHYGVVDPARHRFVNRHDLWEASHRRDEAGALLRCTDDDDCGGGRSTCDVDLGVALRERDDLGRPLGACTIPYRDRRVRPIVYHLSEGSRRTWSPTRSMWPGSGPMPSPRPSPRFARSSVALRGETTATARGWPPASPSRSSCAATR